ncbi:MAG: hypothetical protein Q9163_001202 [Psora crenata]
MLLTGPQGTPYREGLWKVFFKIPEDYPKNPPKVFFRTKIWHPNVEENTGSVCVDTLKKDWDPKLTLRDVLICQTISCLLIQANPDSALNSTAGYLLQDDYDSFCRQAKLMTSIHASIPPDLREAASIARRRGEVPEVSMQKDDEVLQSMWEGELAGLSSKTSPRKSPPTYSAQVPMHTIQSEDESGGEEDETLASKENDPALSPVPVQTPGPRKSTITKRPLSDLPCPSQHDIGEEAKYLSPSEQNIMRNATHILTADKKPMCSQLAVRSSMVNSTSRGSQYLNDDEKSGSVLETIGSEIGRPAKKVRSNEAKGNELAKSFCLDEKYLPRPSGTPPKLQSAAVGKASGSGALGGPKAGKPREYFQSSQHPPTLRRHLLCSTRSLGILTVIRSLPLILLIEYSYDPFIMRVSSVVALAAATAPIAVSAKGRLGYAIGVRRSGKSIPGGWAVDIDNLCLDDSCKSTEDFVEDFKVLQSAGEPATYVRTYAAIDGGANSIGGPSCPVPGAILPAAVQTGMKVVLGLWADTESAFKADMDEVMKHAKEYSNSIYAFTVGSEGLYRQEQKPGTGYTADYILDKINQLKKALQDAGMTQKVGTADSWNKYQDGTADPLISGGVDLMLVNAFGYWQSQDISNASATYLDDLQQAYGHIQSVAGSTNSIELWNGETGWPTDGGSDYHDPNYSTTAVAGTQNAQTFYKNGVCAALDWNFDVFYFEAFNEPWKPASVGLGGQEGDETHWGAFDVDRKQVIPDLSCSYP